MTHGSRFSLPSCSLRLFEHRHRYGHHGRRHHLLRPPRGRRGRNRDRDQKGIQEKGHAAPSSASCSHLDRLLSAHATSYLCRTRSVNAASKGNGIESDVSRRTPMIPTRMKHSNVSAKRTKRFRIPMTSVPSFLPSFFPFPRLLTRSRVYM